MITLDATLTFKNYLFSAKINVLYKPECGIRKHVMDNVLYLKCVVEAFPPNVIYYWYHNNNIISGNKFTNVILTCDRDFELSVYLKQHYYCQLGMLPPL